MGKVVNPLTGELVESASLYGPNGPNAGSSDLSEVLQKLEKLQEGLNRIEEAIFEQSVKSSSGDMPENIDDIVAQMAANIENND